MRTLPRVTRPLLLAPALGVLTLGLTGCGDPPQYLRPGQAGIPAGVLEGTLTYAGPLPCTESQHVVGAAILEVFNTELLPPPEGLGTTAASLAVVPGDDLFAGVEDRLTFNHDGTRWCPAASAAPVTVSDTWTAGPLCGIGPDDTQCYSGQYEVRGFYDLAGTFQPGLIVDRLPVKGDIGGGAIDNAAAVLQGAAPVYRRIALGTQNADGSYAPIPALGAVIGGVTVELALPLPLDLPIFHVNQVTYSSNVCTKGVLGPAPMMAGDPNNPVMPADYQLPVFGPAVAMATQTQDSLIKIGLQSGVALSEAATASKSPFDFPVNPASPFHFTWQDVNGDGKLDLPHDHVAASTLVPSLFPLSIFNRTDDTLGPLVAQAEPAVILQGLTLYKDLVNTALWGMFPPMAGFQDYPEVIVGVSPALLCMDPNDPAKGATLLLSHLTDCSTPPNKLLSDPKSTVATLKTQFGRDVTIVEGCLPQGKYAMNLVYDTGQAWTVPNEAGICAANEPPYANGTMCGDSTTTAHRAVLASQSVVLTITPPSDPSYCVTHPTPPACLAPKM